MDALKNLVLNGKCRILNSQEMKLIKGQSYFACSCDGQGANPPFKKSWVGMYFSTDDMSSDLRQACKHGGGCRQL
ncbi:hypothetical protein DW083_21675 [Parabacteroides sp. AF48-14]|uniref:hypothetical protein n=1 Tax=Parabacteroides sp. AF48-14 TaxID=2292052 RepID=UPI000EFF94E8|nr:hypothetical protein [Parabacteroides sp. AF48-14]RHO63793.1 hypothetical protein DW083_21675 [Parabacteroides sp. AF48-14]